MNIEISNLGDLYHIIMMVCGIGALIIGLIVMFVVLKK